MKDVLGKTIHVGDPVIYIKRHGSTVTVIQGVVKALDEHECKIIKDDTGKESAWILPKHLVLLRP